MTEAAKKGYERVWKDFLQNKRERAEMQASSYLKLLPTDLNAERDADLLVTVADYAYIAGAVRGNEVLLLQRALSAYRRHLQIVPHNTSARRMMAETLLRLRNYKEAFRVFHELFEESVEMASECLDEFEVAPFCLRHDADHISHLVGECGLPDSFQDIARGYRTIADELELVQSDGLFDGAVSTRLHRTLVRKLPDAQTEALKQQGYHSMVPRQLGTDRLFDYEFWSACDPLAHHDAAKWEDVQMRYMSERVVVIEDFFSADTISELRRFVLEAPVFRTVRAGFLGAFPADGFTHPIILKLAVALERRMPQVLNNHPLGLWWLFKYTDEAPNGIGIHADPAAVNINIWLTPDEARVSGGGLTIFKHVPSEQLRVQDFNREFGSAEDELAMRRNLEQAGAHTIDYKFNTAVLFVSDQYHESQPFVFRPGYNNHRVNLTLLFGDRLQHTVAAAAPPQHTATSAAPAPDPLDLFD